MGVLFTELGKIKDEHIERKNTFEFKFELLTGYPSKDI